MKFLNKILTLMFTVSVFCSQVEAQDVNIVDAINQSGHISIVLPDALHNRITFNNENVEGATSQRIIGYRVQVFSDSNSRTAKASAEKLASSISKEFPDYQPHIIYEAPHWRLRIGDFRTREEAETLAQEIKDKFPNLRKEVRVVRCHIEIFK